MTDSPDVPIEPELPHESPSPPPQPWQPSAPPLATGKDRWRIPTAIAILVLAVVPGIAVALVALAPVVGRGWIAAIVATILSLVGFLVFLVFVYVVAYVVSAAWHDAQNSRRRQRR